MKVAFSLASVMGDPRLSITTSPFAPGVTIIKRASFQKGQTPPHLEKFLIKKGECKGRTGVVVGPRGNPIPSAAACVKEKHGK